MTIETFPMGPIVVGKIYIDVKWVKNYTDVKWVKALFKESAYDLWKFASVVNK